ncbi:MAG TPA: tetratricopeptide repeat protein [Candidatus Angelobacter sp.]|nr:tetratricopeptide repeat protein [Candidatus Angelobacter sp.]
MKLNLDPKLLDVVKTREGALATGESVLTGTVVEILGSGTVLVDIADERGISKDLVSLPVEQIEILWRSPTADNAVQKPGSEQSFEEGALLLQNGMIQEAKLHFARAFEADPTLAGTLMNMAIDLSKRGAFESAVVVYQIILELQPEYTLARDNLAASYVNRGAEYARRGAIDKALHLFNEALYLDPSEVVARISIWNVVAAYTELGLHHVAIKRYSDALRLFLLAFQLMPSNPTRRNLGLAMVSNSAWKHEGTDVAAEEGSFREPLLMGLTLSECLNAYGATLASLGRMSEAENFVSRAIDLDPANKLAKTNLAILRQKSVEQFTPSMWGHEAITPKMAAVGGAAA